MESPLPVCREISRAATQTGTPPPRPAGTGMRGALFPAGAGLVPNKLPWDSDV